MIFERGYAPTGTSLSTSRSKKAKRLLFRIFLFLAYFITDTSCIKMFST